MKDTHDDVTRAPDTRHPGLVSRLVGVLFSPRQAFGAIVARPRWLGALFVVALTMASASGWLVSTEVGQQALLEQQVSAMESFGVTVSDEMYDQLASGLENATYFAAGSVLVFIPLVTLILAGVVWTVCYVLLGAHTPFRAMYAVVAHAGAVNIVQQLFVVPLNYTRGVMSNPTTLAAFFPMLETGTFTQRFLGMIDLFIVWQLMVLAIGIAVLYGRRTGPFAATFYTLYAVLAVGISFVMIRIGG
ncbi:MAG: YIP1 family protein [Vicinamibacterales bacterium]|jgi:hypothetical protein|nr:YIP1 family protein [Vicinamibacterales bacterium]